MRASSLQVFAGLGGCGFCGINGAPAAAHLSSYAQIPRDCQLRSQIVSEVHRGRRQWPYESSSSVRRWAAQDRSSLRCYAETLSSPSGRPTRVAIKAGDLAQALKGAGVANLACQGWYTRLRNAVGSHVLWALAELPSDTPIWFYTLMPASWRMPVSQLAGFAMSDIVEPLRVRLYERGLGRQGGWVIASLHGEHLLGDIVHPHLHVIVVGEKAMAFERLCELPMFKGGDDQPVRAPIKRYEAANPPRQVGYLFQHGWTYQTDDDPESDQLGARVGRRRPPELNHAKYLLWRARQRLSDVTWMHGIRLRGGFFVPG